MASDLQCRARCSFQQKTTKVETKRIKNVLLVQCRRMVTAVTVVIVT